MSRMTTRPAVQRRGGWVRAGALVNGRPGRCGRRERDHPSQAYLKTWIWSVERTARGRTPRPGSKRALPARRSRAAPSSLAAYCCSGTGCCGCSTSPRSAKINNLQSGDLGRAQRAEDESAPAVKVGAARQLIRGPELPADAATEARHRGQRVPGRQVRCRRAAPWALCPATLLALAFTPLSPSAGQSGCCVRDLCGPVDERVCRAPFWDDKSGNRASL